MPYNYKHLVIVIIIHYVAVMNKTHHTSSTGIKDARKDTFISKFMRMYAWSVECKGTNYYKVFILGNTGIYYAHPIYGHADYNKTRVCNITPYTKRLMNYFNNLLN